MKQEIITYLSTIKQQLFDLSKYIYDNPEHSFNEYKSSKYIINILRQNNFNITENFLNIPTAFFAQYGSGHPKICYICEYDAVENKGHINGHNLISSMSIGAGLALAKIIDKISGSVVVLGCPGELVGGAKVTMVKQGVFSDMDLVLMAHPNVFTAESGTSAAILPLSIKFKSNEGLSYLKKEGYSALDACIYTFTALNQLTKGFSKDVVLDGIIANGGNTPLLIPNSAEAKFYIRASSINSANSIEIKIRELVKSTSSLMNIDNEISLYELPYEELITNRTLSRIFCHNLKENGIIDCDGIKDTNSGLSIGNVSHALPCIHPYINIIEDSSIEYATTAFGKATLSQFAQDRALKAAQTLAITGLDLLQKEELLNEVRNEFYNNKK